MRASGVLLAATVAALGACNDRPQAPPLPEVLVVVDTNLPAPLVASRLRIDLYAEDGTWFDSFEVARPSAADWPASFSVFSDDESRERLVWVRLRVFPDGRVSDYRGERLRDWSNPFAEPASDGTPRLVKDGRDVTPRTEPQPLVTVDRLVLVRLRPEKRGRLRVLLHGACIGTMPLFGGAAGVPALGGAESCVDEEKKRAPVVESPLEDELATPTESLQGTWLAEPCPPASADSPVVCVPGGATILGSALNTPEVTLGAGILDTLPVRVFALRRFFIDRNEMSVARFRELVAQGKASASSGIVFNDGPITGFDGPGTCTFSRAARDREDWALCCVEHARARETCKALGGDLPTEAQWEHAATLAGRTSKAIYPWGDDPPRCDRAVYGREPEPQVGAKCAALGLGPQSLAANASDVSALGIVGLAGGHAEWTRDDYVAYTSPCWRDAPLVEPECAKGAMLRTIRGGSWSSPMLRMSYRLGAPTSANDVIGFRCVYPTDPGAR